MAWGDNKSRDAVSRSVPANAPSRSFWSPVNLLKLPFQLMRLPIDAALFSIDRIAALGYVEGPAVTHQLRSGPEPEPSATPDLHACSDGPLQVVPSVALPPRADLHGGDLKLVRSRILFIRRGLEVSFASREDLISDDLETPVFEAWKIAEFVQNLADPRKAPEIPEAWHGYLTSADRHPNGRIRRIPAGDQKYLRVFFEVLGYHPRESLRYREDQLRILREISGRLESDPMRWR